jgi:hypothetical protein
MGEKSGTPERTFHDATNLYNTLYHKSDKSNIPHYSKDHPVPIIFYTYTTHIVTKIFLILLEKFEDTKEIIRSHIGKFISSFLSSCLLLNLPSLSILRCRSRYEFITSHS